MLIFIDNRLIDYKLNNNTPKDKLCKKIKFPQANMYHQGLKSCDKNKLLKYLYSY